MRTAFTKINGKVVSRLRCEAVQHKVLTQFSYSLTFEVKIGWDSTIHTHIKT